jgi:hypothetical protein
MLAILYALGMFIADLFKSRSRLGAENLFLRHQLNTALRQKPSRIRLRGRDRALLVWMVRLWPSLLNAVQVVQPETVFRWHRAGVRAFWRWKSRNRAGRPRIDRELRTGGLRKFSHLDAVALQPSRHPDHLIRVEQAAFDVVAALPSEQGLPDRSLEVGRYGERRSVPTITKSLFKNRDPRDFGCGGALRRRVGFKLFCDGKNNGIALSVSRSSQ